MHKWLHKIDHWNSRDVLWYSIAAAILLAAWMQYIQHGWINSDSVLYLEQGSLIADGHWRAAYHVFNWPFYGACIGLLHAATHLGVHVSAQVLNMLFFAIATGAYLKIIQLAGGASRAMLAGVLLLFSSQYIVGDVLEMLMRDEGFWAFYLLSIFFFIRYAQKQNLRDALAWQASMTVAMLFRIEGVIFLLLLPIVVCFLPHHSWRHKHKAIMSNYALVIAGAIVIISLLITHSALSMQQFGRLREVFSFNLYHEFTQTFVERSSIMSENVLGKYLEEFAAPGLLLTFVYAIVNKSISTIGIIAAIFAALGLKNRCHLIEQTARCVLITSACIALLTMALTIIKVFVLAGRYVVPLDWILLIIASFYLANFFSHQKWSKLSILIGLILVLGIISNILPKRPGYNYMQTAVAWLQTHHTNNQPVFYNDPRMRHFAKVPFDGMWEINEWGKDYPGNQIDSKKQMEMKKNHFVALNLSLKEVNVPLLLNQHFPEYQEVKRFCNYKKSKCAIILEAKT